MRCPFCSAIDTRVVDSRVAREGRAIRRRRACEECTKRFTTYEIIEATRPDVLKQDGRTEPFERTKVLQSLRLACKKRPVGLEALTDFAEHLEASLSLMPRRLITTREVGEASLAFLKSQDPVAYVRYASVYRSFDNVDEFMDELQAIQYESSLIPRASDKK
jgi:transcriptional repressor NrdR